MNRIIFQGSIVVRRHLWGVEMIETWNCRGNKCVPCRTRFNYVRSSGCGHDDANRPPVSIVALLLFLQHLFSSVLLLVLKEVA
jgi:hypothetical protein